MAKEPVRLIGYREIADDLGVETKTVRAWKMRGNLPAPDYMVGQSPAWKPGTLTAFLEHFRATGRPGKQN